MTGRDRAATSPQARGAKPRNAMLAVVAASLLVVGFAATPAAGQAIDPLMLGLVPIGKPVPEFDLPPVQGRTLGLSDRDLKGEVSLVNVFASWCGPCREEHPLLMDLASRNTVPIHGLNYKDRPESARRWLDRLGDPYTRTGADRDGRVAIDLGIFGVPQTFVVARSGRIAYVHIGVLDEVVLEQTILPLVEKLRSRDRQQPEPYQAGRGDGDVRR